MSSAAPPDARALGLVRRAARRLHAAASADGADRSGLAALLWAHSLQSVGDGMLAASLATTAFFQVSASEARGQIALYLLLTLLPFAFLVPVAGPLLDRFPHGRRNVLALTTGGRGLVAWTLAGSLSSMALYPQALTVLALARAYGVARAAAVVRVRPPELGLVASNARLNVAGFASSGVGAAVGAAVANAAGGAWSLRLAAGFFLAAGVAALRLPSHVDDRKAAARVTNEPFLLRESPHAVRRPLVATASLRALSGMLALGLAILLKAHHASVVTVTVVLGAAFAGSILGTGLASRLSARRTAKLTALALLAPSAACLAAALGGSTMLRGLAVGLVGLGASLGKYALDAALQTQVPTTQTGAAFARSETVLQLSWALGGGVGLAASLADHTPLGGEGAIGLVFGLATALAVAGLVVAARWSSRSRPSAA